jgi:hypothetical protein
MADLVFLSFVPQAQDTAAPDCDPLFLRLLKIVCREFGWRYIDLFTGATGLLPILLLASSLIASGRFRPLQAASGRFRPIHIGICALFADTGLCLGLSPSFLGILDLPLGSRGGQCLR